MCGIFAYIGSREAYSLIINGLERLEYRGYDSAGICTSDHNQLIMNKAQGRVENLKSKVLPGTFGIGHNRWATHGQPSDRNAHPFLDRNKQFAIVHNGIIENYLELKEELRQEGIIFTSDTDSEVIVHLISKYYPHARLTEAVIKTSRRLQGAYAFCVIKNDLREIIGARHDSPLIAGVGEQENFLSSDISAIIGHTKKIIHVKDFQIVRITEEIVELFNFQNEPQPLEIKEIKGNVEKEQKPSFKHFMLKEIFEQPSVVQKILQHPPSFAQFSQKPQRIIIIACGTASYAGFIGKYILEKITKIPVINEIASEFRYKEPLLTSSDLVMAISQSGETADTLAAVRLAKNLRIRTLGIINVANSSIASEVDDVIYTEAGSEIGVASTKAFLAQVTVLYQLAYSFSHQNFFPSALAQTMEKMLSLNEEIRKIALKYCLFQNFLYLGRNVNYPLALEGALKLKEISYLHAEAYPAGELKHGPIALISEEMPTLAICPEDEVYSKMLNNIEEIKARRGKIIVIATEGDNKIKNLSNDLIFIPKADAILYPFLITIALQLFAYHIADLRGCDIDKPRNLAKSVTVE
ncbi:glutamine--fructose-6-phosphate transaminase (isomerizing) [Candidatus Woesearchaeota archaeon]|nr:glutamine--fructose-6-phosphate transaminase (isomerizing) [Candidatus Woesearchaeota archaeon]